ncbi:MAG: Stp1/IreP family PP2C-type Ser/Thr phosphatase [Clostridia bacterium]|nr:Stp1/IreP family PP2C-type Ser/Thr phosphatase [Clostridia bacterium]
MKAYYKSHVGLVREQNEDTVLADDRQGIFILADGMGGHQAGEVASLLAATTLRDTLAGRTPSAEGMQQGFRAANSTVYRRSLEDSALNGMGTTMTALWDHGDHILLGHVGDSRAYLFLDGRLRQISEDHSLVGDLVRSGAITEEEAFHHPYRNVITRAVGTDETVRTDVVEILKTPGEKWLLCSDGLTDLVRDPEIAETLAAMDSQAAVDRLIELALLHGGKDNVSVMLLEVDA